MLLVLFMKLACELSSQVYLACRGLLYMLECALPIYCAPLDLRTIPFVFSGALIVPTAHDPI